MDVVYFGLISDVCSLRCSLSGNVLFRRVCAVRLWPVYILFQFLMLNLKLICVEDAICNHMDEVYSWVTVYVSVFFIYNNNNNCLKSNIQCT